MVSQVDNLLEAEEEEGALWEKIESVRHQLTRSLNPAKLTPYLRQCRVIDEQDEEEVLSAFRFPCKSNRTGLLMDILRRRGKRGYEAFLESLEFYYPEHFTRLTGKQPVQRCSMILDEEGPEGLTQFLMMEVKKARAQRKGHLAKEYQLQVKNEALEEESAQLKRQLQELQKVQERCRRLQEEWDSNSLELLRLKDENYLLAMRYAQLCEEKNAAILRSRDLQLGVDQLKCRVSGMEEECALLRKQALAAPQREVEDHSLADTVSELRAENQRLMTSLQELQNAVQVPGQVPGSERILLDILEHDWKEAQADRQELCQKLDSVQNELQWAEELRDKYLHDVEDLQLKYQTLQKNCDLYKHRMNTVLAQLDEIEKERDQAIQSRDGIQLQYSQSLVEKDQYRKRVRALEEERDELLSKLTQAEGKIGTLEAQLQRCNCTRGLAKKVCLKKDVTDRKERKAAGPRARSERYAFVYVIPLQDVSPDTEKEINRLSIFPFPPCAGSILRRQREEGLAPIKSNSLVVAGRLLQGRPQPPLPLLAEINGAPCILLIMAQMLCGDFSASLFVVVFSLPCRSVVLHLSSAGPLSIPAPQSRGLAGDISILGGNRTGIYIQWVRPGSEVEKAGLREGCRLEAVLMHALFFLSGYLPLQEARDAGRKVPGDSFYVRVNLSLLELADPLALCVKCQEILHVTDTLHKGRLEWYCARVDPFTLRDLDRGTHSLIFLSLFPSLPLPCGSFQLKKRALDQLRLVKHKQPDEAFWKDPCPDGVVKPYSPVRPLVVQTCRPVVLSPGCLAPQLIRKLLDLPSSHQDFYLCPSDALPEQRFSSGSCKNILNADMTQCSRDHGRIRTIQEAAGKNKHCLLELEVQVVRDLIKSEIYPIIIHVEVTEKNIRGVRSLLGKVGQRDSEVLKQCQWAEWSLRTLPSSWTRVDPQSWGSTEELVKVVRAHIFQEQARIVWVEESDM
uniref:Caspase recruitment domain family member 10 n=1 Tax=Varanus komodoensis TaxID=61221 RepID=A0A8D2KUZ6_VARKO